MVCRREIYDFPLMMKMNIGAWLLAPHAFVDVNMQLQMV